MFCSRSVTLRPHAPLPSAAGPWDAVSGALLPQGSPRLPWAEAGCGEQLLQEGI